jgi:hypothetical protein
MKIEIGLRGLKRRGQDCLAYRLYAIVLAIKAVRAARARRAPRVGCAEP